MTDGVCLNRVLPFFDRERFVFREVIFDPGSFADHTDVMGDQVAKEFFPCVFVLFRRSAFGRIRGL
jgi:hypothetical protein